MSIKKLSILIPAYNEARTIHLILDRVKDVKLVNDIEKEVIIVNDCSSDDTVLKIEEYMKNNPDFSIQLFSQDRNRGKGADINRAIQECTGEIGRASCRERV